MQWQQVLHQQQQMLQSLQSQQAALQKQEQISSLVQHVVGQKGSAPSSAGYTGRQVTCFYCNKPGHIKAKCYLRIRHESEAALAQAQTQEHDPKEGNKLSTVESSKEGLNKHAPDRRPSRGGQGQEGLTC